MEVLIGKLGFITNEGVREPYVVIQDLGESSGGYLVLTMSNPPPSTKGSGYDDWILKEELEGYIEAKGWNIDWSISE